MFCPKCGVHNDETAVFCAQCGASLAQQAPMAPMPMKWYKFLIYFSLFAGSILNIGSGISILNGSYYGDVADLVYATFKGLKTVDMLMAVAAFATAALGIYVRFRLAQYRKDGPALLTWLYVISIVTSVLYIVAVAAVLPAEVRGDVVASSVTSGVPSVVASVVMVFVNRVYFNKRAHLFNK